MKLNLKHSELSPEVAAKPFVRHEPTLGYETQPIGGML